MRKRNNLKNIFKKLFTALMIVALGVNSVYATTAPSSLTLTHSDYAKPPVSFPSTFHVAKTSDGKYVYCTDYLTKSPVSSVSYKRGNTIDDAGAKYILAQGYNAKNDNEYFVAQTALWIYMQEKGLMNHANNIDKFRTTIDSSSNTYATQIKKLVNKAKETTSYDNSDPTISLSSDTIKFTLSEDKQNYVSNEIQVTSSETDYKIELVDAPEGAQISKGDNGIVITVPASAVGESKSTFSVKVSNSKTLLEFYKYTPSNNKYQTMAAVYPVSKEASDTKSMSITGNKVVISKQDITNKEELPGATLVVKDSEGNEIDKWVSGTTPHEIPNLKPGTYTLTETIAPEGYELSTETIEFTVDENGGTTNVVMYNTPVKEETPTPETPTEEVAVPSTGSNKTIASSMIGALIIIIGSVLITKNIKKNAKI